MNLHFSENKINMFFHIDDDGRVSLLHFSNSIFREKDIAEGAGKWFAPVEVQLSGGNQDYHQGMKHVATCGSNSLRYESHQFYENIYGNKLEMVLSDSDMRAVVHYQFYRDLSVIRAWTTITNISEHHLGLEYISSFSLTGIGKENMCGISDRLHLWIPHNSWCREVDWREYTLSEAGLKKNSRVASKRIAVMNTGTWSTKEYLPMGALIDSENGSAYMWQIENNGSWHWEISDIADYLYLKLSGPTNENGWHKELAPGKIFESVKVAIAVEESYDGALGQLTHYRRKIMKRNSSDVKLPVIFNDYMYSVSADPTTEKMLPIIDKAAEVGAEYYCMDAGWYADGTWWDTVGEWQPVSWRFPNGITEVFDYIKSKGMIPGIWLEIESMGIHCPILEQFTDDCFFMRHGRRVVVRGRYQLDFRNEKVRRFAADVIERVVNEYGVGYIKIDYNIDGGVGTEVCADSFGEGLMEHNRAYLSWLEEVMERYPNVVIENCSSGGMRMDYAMLSRLSIQSITDMSEYRKIIPIAAAAASATLPEQAAIWSYPRACENEEAIAGNMVNAMMLRMHLSGEIHKLNQEQVAIVKEGVSYYKSIRKDIADAVPFYPLGIETLNKNWLCTGYRCRDKQYWIVWRFESQDSTIKIPLDDEIKNIKITYPLSDNGKLQRTNNEVQIELAERYSSVVLELV